MAKKKFMSWEVPKSLKNGLFGLLGYVAISVAIKFARYNPEVVSYYVAVILFSILALLVIKRHKILSFIKKAVLGFKDLKLSYRIFIWAACIWFICVFAFVFAFEPFGYRMSDSDWVKAWKILLVPPIVSFLAYYSYIKITKTKDEP